jgi:hypothetical protein
LPYYLFAAAVAAAGVTVGSQSGLSLVLRHAAIGLNDIHGSTSGFATVVTNGGRRLIAPMFEKVDFR